MRHAFFDFVLSHRIAVCLILAGITAFMGWHAARVAFDNSIETYFLEDDLREYDRFLEQFGTDEVIVAAFSDRNLFSETRLSLIDAISREVARLPHVRSVLSLTTARTATDHGMRRLVARVPTSTEALESIRRAALADPLISRALLSSDARSTAIVAEVDHIIGEFEYKVVLLKKIKSILKHEETETGIRFHIGGTSVLDEALFRYARRDQALFFPLIILIIAAAMFLLFRRVDVVLLPLAVVSLTFVWTYGALVLLGYRINVISTVIGPFLVAVGTADSIHVIADYHRESAKVNRNRGYCIKVAFDGLLVPCFMTSLTTALGLLSLLCAELAPIRQFGLVAAIGVLFAFLITIVLLPVLLSFLPFPESRHRLPGEGGTLGAFLHWLESWTRKRAVVVLLITGLGVLPALFSLTRLTVGTNSLDYFRKDDPVRVQTEWIDDRIGGTTSLEFLLETRTPGALEEPSLLKKVREAQDYLSGIDGVTGVFSPVDIITAVNRAMSGEDAIPDSAEDVSWKMSLLEGNEDVARFLSPDFSRGRIMARVRMAASQGLAHRMDGIVDRMRAILGEEATARPTGVVYLMNRMERYLLSSQIKSFLLALVVIFFVMLGMLRSLRLGILAMIPNVLPIVFVMALMPVLGISLDVGTVMIAGVALGLIVDDTIHFLYRFRMEMRDAESATDAVQAAMKATGRPIVSTSLILGLGFLVLIFASFNPVIHFGILTTGVILLALVFDLLVLPALLVLLRWRRAGA